MFKIPKKNNKGLIITIIIILLLLFSIAAFVGGIALSEAKEQFNDNVAQIPSNQVEEPSEVRDNIDSTTEKESDIINTPPPSQDTTCSLSGEWENIWVKRRTSIDPDVSGLKPKEKGIAIFKYTGTCKSDVYLESGINPSSRGPLSVAPTFFRRSTTPSWCDSNRNYYGYLFQNVDPGDRLLAIGFSPMSPDTAGTYDLTIGAYTGCLGTKTTTSAIQEGGRVISEKIYSIKISNDFSESIGGSATNSWDHVVG